MPCHTSPAGLKDVCIPAVRRAAAVDAPVAVAGPPSQSRWAGAAVPDYRQTLPDRSTGPRWTPHLHAAPPLSLLHPSTPWLSWELIQHGVELAVSTQHGVKLTVSIRPSQSRTDSVHPRQSRTVDSVHPSILPSQSRTDSVHQRDTFYALTIPIIQIRRRLLFRVESDLYWSVRAGLWSVLKGQWSVSQTGKGGRSPAGLPTTTPATMGVTGRLCEVAGVHACYSCVLYLLPVVHRTGETQGMLTHCNTCRPLLH